MKAFLSISTLFFLFACNSSTSESNTENPIESSTSTLGERQVEAFLIGKWEEQVEEYGDTVRIFQDSIKFGITGKSGIHDSKFGAKYYASGGQIGQDLQGNKSVMFEYEFENDTLWLEFCSLEHVNGKVDRTAPNTSPYLKVSDSPE